MSTADPQPSTGKCEEEPKGPDEGGYTMFDLPRGALAAFEAYRTRWVSALPEELRKRLVKCPPPHITIVYGCTSKEDVVSDAASRAFAAKPTMHCEFGSTLITGTDSPVVIFPILSQDIVDLFTAWYNTPAINPAGTKSKSFLNADIATEKNPLGFCPHVTLAWFEPDTDFSALNIHGAKVEPATFVLRNKSFVFKPLKRPAYADRNTASSSR